MDQEEKIYITGHQNPDTDSIASAIGYAFFKQALGCRSVACRLGKVNHETDYLLKRFGFEAPQLLVDARKTLAEIDMDSPIAVSPDITIYDAIMKMQETGRAGFGVVDDAGRLIGMVTKSDLTAIGLGDTAVGIELLKQTPVENICRTINGQMIYQDSSQHLNGKVSIIALTKTRLENYEIQNRIVIVGDDADAQRQLIRKGAGMLIIVWAKEVDPSVIAEAKNYHCQLIVSGHGSMNTSRYIYFAPPVRLVMKTKLVSFSASELAEDAGRKMMSSRFRDYPVLDAEGHLVGYISRYHIMNYQNKKIILVDHNEFSQSVRAVEKAQLLEVVDHHRICDFMTSQPVSFRNEIVGSTATIIATMFRENQIPMPQKLAGLLLGAVLSDTLMFQSPTTTQKDKDTANILAALADLDIPTFGRDLFSVQGNIKDAPIADLITQDVKYFEIRSARTMISQVTCNSLKDLADRTEEIQQAAEEMARKKDLDLLAVVFTSVLEKGSVFYGAGEKKGWLLEAFPDQAGETHSIQPGILSRKSQILPRLSEVIGRYA